MAGRRACSAGTSSSANAATGSAAGRCSSAGCAGSMSASSRLSGRAGSHGLCCVGTPSRDGRGTHLLDEHLQVGDLRVGDRTGCRGRTGAGRPNEAQSASVTHGRSASRDAVPGRRPPTRPVWKATSDEWPSRA